MITDFQGFGAVHLISLALPVLLGAVFLILRRRPWGQVHKKELGIALAVLIVTIRAVRYGMDIAIGRFEILDLFSLHVCHINLVLLAICLCKPSKPLFSSVFLLGIPMGLVVALFPGAVHPEPGLLRAAFFIMSHMMLVVGAIYLSMTECIRLSAKSAWIIIGLGNLALIGVYFVNRALGSNYLYIMRAPEGTVIEQLALLFGWPGYVLIMDLLAIACILLMLLLARLLHRLYRCTPSAAQADQNGTRNRLRS